MASDTDNKTFIAIQISHRVFQACQSRSNAESYKSRTPFLADRNILRDQAKPTNKKNRLIRKNRDLKKPINSKNSDLIALKISLFDSAFKANSKEGV